MHLRIGRIVEEAERVLHAPREARLERRPGRYEHGDDGEQKMQSCDPAHGLASLLRTCGAGRRLALDAPTSMRPPQAPSRRSARRRSPSGGRAGVFQKPAIGAQRGRAAEKRPFRRGEYLSAAAAPRRGPHARAPPPAPARRAPPRAGLGRRGVRRKPASSSQGIGSGTRPRARWWGRLTRSRIRPKASRVPHARLVWGLRRPEDGGEGEEGPLATSQITVERRLVGERVGVEVRLAGIDRGEQLLAGKRAGARARPGRRRRMPRRGARREARDGARHHCSLISPMGSRTTCGMRQLAGERGDHDEVGASRRRGQQRGEVPVEVGGAGRLAHRLA